MGSVSDEFHRKKGDGRGVEKKEGWGLRKKGMREGEQEGRKKRKFKRKEGRSLIIENFTKKIVKWM